MKVALVYDRINKWGGAERVLLALHRIFPDAPLFTSVYDSKKAPWAKVFDVKTSFLQRFPFLISNHEKIPFLMPIAFEQFNFDSYDLVVSVTSEAAKGIITKPHTHHICYCLTPTRYLWSGYDIYFKNKIFKYLTAPLVAYLRKWDKIASLRPDKYLTLSTEVKKRIKKYYNLDSEIIYPPLMLENLKNSNNITSSKYNSYFLVVSRLVSYKRIDLAIDACNSLNLPLKIIGTGKEKQTLREKSGPTIEFLGNVAEADLIQYYKNCKALIHPGIEDFGLSIIEAQKYGKPVIAFNGGGALDTVINKKTGLLFSSQTKESLIKVLKDFKNYKFDPKDCIEASEKYSFEKFKKSILKSVQLQK